MQILLNNAVFNDQKLKTLITKITVEELNNLTQPCYRSDWKKYYSELIHCTNLLEKDIKNFIKRFYINTKAKDSLIQSDVGSNFLFILMYHFLLQRDESTFTTLIILHMIRQYSNLSRIFFKFCKEEVFTYTLNHLNPSHLFIREKTIPNALFYLSKQMKLKYSKYFIELNAEKVSLFLYESRSRISQSLRSFANEYYINDSKGFGISGQKETETGEEIYPASLERGNRISELISDKITIYKETDQKALTQARSLTRINTSYATLIVSKLQNTELKPNIKFIIELYLKDMTSINQLCGKDSLLYIKKLMSIKKTTKEVYFKQEISNLLEKIIKGTIIQSKFQKLTPQTQFQINSFLAFYLTLYTKNLVC